MTLESLRKKLAMGHKRVLLIVPGKAPPKNHRVRLLRSLGGPYGRFVAENDSGTSVIADFDLREVIRFVEHIEAEGPADLGAASGK